MNGRPAESGGVAAAVGLLIGRLAGVHDPDTLVALGVVVGFVPAAITWTVSLRAPRRPSRPGTSDRPREPAPNDGHLDYTASPPPGPEEP